MEWSYKKLIISLTPQIAWAFMNLKLYTQVEGVYGLAYDTFTVYYFQFLSAWHLKQGQERLW